MSTRRQDITGKKFGKLTAIESTGVTRFNNALWLCKCDCGNEITTTTASLNAGNTKSCGCLHKEKIHEYVLSLGNNPATKALWHDYRKSARTRSIEFTLTFDQFKQLTSDNCFYCGNKPARAFSDKRFLVPYISNGIDRRDNNKGYTLENSVPCCQQCNYAKRTITEKEFLEWVNTIYHYQKSINSEF